MPLSSSNGSSMSSSIPSARIHSLIDIVTDYEETPSTAALSTGGQVGSSIRSSISSLDGTLWFLNGTSVIQGQSIDIRADCPQHTMARWQFTAVSSCQRHMHNEIVHSAFIRLQSYRLFLWYMYPHQQVLCLSLFCLQRHALLKSLHPDPAPFPRHDAPVLFRKVCGKRPCAFLLRGRRHPQPAAHGT